MAYQKLQASRALEVIPSDTVDIPNPAMLAISSTTTGAAAGKLIDSAGDFINKRVKIGDIVYGGTTVAATVTAVDSATQLSVSTAVPTTTAYKLYSNDAPNNGCVLYIADVSSGIKTTVITAGGDEVTFRGFTAGSFVPVQVKRVKDSGTDSTYTIALW